MTIDPPSKPLTVRHDELWHAVAAGEMSQTKAALTLIEEGYTLTVRSAEDVMRFTPLELKRGYLPGADARTEPFGR